MRVFVTGAGGQLGHDVVAHCVASGDEVIAAERSVLDIADRDAVHQAIGSVEPDAVINAAAYTAVDQCETEVATAFAVNAMGPRNLADACRRAGAHLVHGSTDYVFDGRKTEPYHEWDEPNPQSGYGRSKLAGEREVAHHLPGAAIVRTSWVFGEHGPNMVKTVLSLRDRPELAFVDDQRGCPTATADLAVALRTVAIRRLAGLFHVTNQGAVSWYEFVQDVLELAGEPRDKVRPISTSELDPPRPAPRPANSVLDGAAWRASGQSPLPHYRDALERLVPSLLA